MGASANEFLNQKKSKVDIRGSRSKSLVDTKELEAGEGIVKMHWKFKSKEKRVGA